MHIRIDDTVEVITGENRGTRGKVLRVDRAAGKVVVEGVNRVYKHVRRSQRNPQGGRLSKEMPIQLSNVLLVCGACNAATRTGVRYLDDGSKLRFCKKCSAGIGQIAPPKARRAKIQA
jgi:large subunit ribosomal protein L24